jgi:hypothetical protein
VLREISGIVRGGLGNTVLREILGIVRGGLGNTVLREISGIVRGGLGNTVLREISGIVRGVLGNTVLREILGIVREGTAVGLSVINRMYTNVYPNTTLLYRILAGIPDVARDDQWLNRIAILCII